MISLTSSLSVKKVAVIAAMGLSLGACTNEDMGTLFGAGLGAFVGSEIGGSGNGAIIGAYLGTAVGASVGNHIGRKLDDVDRMKMDQAYYQALEYGPSGQESQWHNPDTGNHGTYDAQPAYRDNSGRYCREYTQEVWIGGERENAYGTACRQEDGSWQIVSDPR